jgi:hypothetical protein
MRWRAASSSPKTEIMFIVFIVYNIPPFFNSGEAAWFIS